MGILRVYMQGWGLTVVLGIHATPKMMPLHPMELFDGHRITGW
jgi:alcohol dehydrogenase